MQARNASPGRGSSIHRRQQAEEARTVTTLAAARQGRCPFWDGRSFLPAAACNAAGARSCRRVPSAGCADDW
jgi:hypothetical protein